MRVLLILGLIIGSVVAAPRQSQRIVGGDPTSISDYPGMVALMFSQGTTNFRQACNGIIITNRSVMTVAHCLHNDAPARWRMRVGSANANSGGTQYLSRQFYIHNEFSISTLANDIAIINPQNDISFTNNIQPSNVAGSSYPELVENQLVMSVGWGATEFGGANSAQLRRGALVIVSQETCTTTYSELGLTITEDMLCAGNGFATPCHGDEGAPLFHNNVIVGLSSFGMGCSISGMPNVHTRLSSFESWIQLNA